VSSFSDSYGEQKAVRGRLSGLPLRRIFLFAAQSIRLRLGRCLVTTASVVFAIAFLSYNAALLQGTGALDTMGREPVAVHTTAQEGAGSAKGFFEGLRSFTAEKNAAQKRLFVVVLSLLVCSVGITNSMLMSVRERYREIATLKCLGATNPTIRKLFMIETLLQGGVGSVLGLVMGLALFLLVGEQAASPMWLLQVSVGCLVVGMVMTLLASVFPVRAALVMMPVEALRVEG